MGFVYGLVSLFLTLGFCIYACMLIVGVIGVFHDSWQENKENRKKLEMMKSRRINN